MIEIVIEGDPEKSALITWLMNHLPHVEEMPRDFHVAVIRALRIQDVEFLRDLKAARIRLEHASSN